MKKWRQNYGTLLGQAALICTLILIPLLVSQVLTFSRARQEVIRQRAVYYEEAVQSFSEYYEAAVQNIEENMWRLRVEEQFAFGQIFSVPYYKTEAVGTLAFYRELTPYVSRLALVIPWEDGVLTDEYSYTTARYLQRYFPEGTALRRKMQKLLKEPLGHEAQVLSSFDELPAQSAELVYIYPGKVGAHSQTNCLLIYSATSKSLLRNYVGFANLIDHGVAIFEKDGTLFFSSDTFHAELCRTDVFRQALHSSSTEQRHIEGADGEYAAFFHRPKDDGRIFVCTVPETVLAANTSAYEKAMHQSMLMLAVLFVGMCCMIVYVSYKPILSLVRHVRAYGHDQPHGNELSTITYAIDSMYSAREEMAGIVSEQRLLLMEYVINNLLYGYPMPTERLAVLGDSIGQANFQVYVLKSLHLESGEQERFSELLSVELGLRTFVTDLPNENFTVVIAVLGKDAEDVQNRLYGLIRREYGEEITIGAGSVVEDVNDLRRSYHSALISCEDAGDSKTGADESHALMQQMLSCMQTGLRDEALDCLEKMRLLLSEKQSYVFSLYSRTQLTSGYISFVRAQNVPIDEKEILSLLTLENPAELFDRLRQSVENVCGLIARRNQDAEWQLKHRIVAYLDDQFTDPALSLTSAADHFGISIYFLSKYLKEQTGMGFREYVSLRRMETARRLLLTTDDTVVQIAAACGFENASYFTTWFRNNQEVSPAAYRSLHRKRSGASE